MLTTTRISILALVLPLIISFSRWVISAENSIEGLWISDGYGLFLEIDSLTVTIKEITAVSCLTRTEKLMKESVEADGSWRLSMEDDQAAAFLVSESHSLLRLKRTGTVSDIMLRRRAEPPDTCVNTLEDTPMNNFKVLWTTYMEHYPLFESKQMDWDAAGQLVRSKISDQTTDTELFDLLSGLFAPLQDAHTGLSAAEMDRTFMVMKPHPEWEDASSLMAIMGQVEEQFASALEIIESDYIQGELQSFCKGHLLFGMLAGNLAYLRLDQEGDYTDDSGFAAQLTIFENALDTVFKQVHQARGLIIDVRKNYGGSDILSLALASRLTPQKYFAYAKVARLDPNNPDRRTPAQDRYVIPSDRPSFHGPVVQLTGPFTISAGETLTQALMGRKAPIVRIGENTQGVFSDTLGRLLPNGWTFWLPNELFLTREGHFFDGPGIPPDIEVPVFRKADIAKGIDPAMEKAISLLSVHDSSSD